MDNVKEIEEYTDIDKDVDNLLQRVLKRHKNKELNKLDTNFNLEKELAEKENDSFFLENIKYHNSFNNYEKEKVRTYIKNEFNYLKDEITIIQEEIYKNLERLKMLGDRDYEQDKKAFDNAMETIKNFYIIYSDNIVFPNTGYSFPPSTSENYFIFEDKIIELLNTRFLDIKDIDIKEIKGIYKKMYSNTIDKTLSTIKNNTNSVKRYQQHETDLCNALKEKLLENK